MIYLLIDILIYNLTSWHSYFFLFNLNSKNFGLIFLVALIIDVFLVHSWGIHLIFMSLIYLIQKYILKINLNNFIYYLLFNVSIFFLYFIIMSLIFKFLNYQILIEAFLINFLMLILSYKFRHHDINLIG